MSRSAGRYKAAMLRRGLLRSWSQFFAVFCMALLSVAAYTGLEGGWHGMEVSLNDYAGNSAMADVWIQTAQVDDGDLAAARALEGINGLEDRVVRSARAIPDAEKPSWISFTSTEDIANWRISVPRVVDGELIDDRGEGVWLSPRYLSEHGLAPGDELIIRQASPDGDRDIVVRIRGSAYSPDQLYDVKESVFLVPEPDQFSYGYLTPQTAEELWGPAWRESSSHQLVVLGESSAATQDALWDCFESDVLRISTRETNGSISTAFDRVTAIRNVSVLFSSLFLLVGVLAMYSSTRRLVDSELKTIATLQAMGYGRGELRLHFSMFGMLAGVAGALAGLGLAPLLSRVALRSQSTQFELPHWQISYTVAPLFVALAVVLACVGGGYLASGSALTRSPALLMRPGLVRASSGAVLLRNLGTGRHHGLSWALRDTASNLVRFAMGIIGVAGCLMLLFAGFGLPDTMENRAVTSFGEGNLDYEYRVDLGALPSVSSPLPGLGANAQNLMQMSVRTTPSDGYDRVVTVLDTGDRFRLHTLDGAAVSDNGLWVTQDTAARLSLSEGSAVTLRLPRGGGEIELPIAGIVATEMPQGFFITRQGWEELGMTFAPTTVLTGTDANSAELLSDPRVGDLVSRAEQQSNALNIRQSLGGIFNLMRVMAIVLCVVVLYCLGDLTFGERRRQYATLSVLGLSPGYLRGLSSIEVVISTVIGVIVGLPGGLWFLNIFVAQVASPRLQYTPYITLVSAVLAIMIAILSALATTVVLGRRIAGIDMVDALKEAE